MAYFHITPGAPSLKLPPSVTCAPIGEVWEGYPIKAALAVGISAGAVLLAVCGIILAYLAGAWGGIAAASPGALIALCAVTIIALAALITLLKLAFNYLFKYKLACVDGDRCAVVHIESIVRNEDSDQSLNTILAPLRDPKTTEAQYKAMWQAATLLYSDTTPPVSSRGWKFRPESNGQEPRFGDNKLPLLHCEIEGRRNYDWIRASIAYMVAMVVVLAVLIALAALGAAVRPSYYILLGMVALLILLAAVFGIRTALSRSKDTDSAISNTDIGIATPGPEGYLITASDSRTIKAGEYAVLYGLHVIDTGHHKDSDGVWCELHPVKAIARIDQATYDTVSGTGPGGVYESLCKAMREYVQRRI